jgi:hypothetical protein
MAPMMATDTVKERHKATVAVWQAKERVRLMQAGVDAVVTRALVGSEPVPASDVAGVIGALATALVDLQTARTRLREADA